MLKTKVPKVVSSVLDQIDTDRLAYAATITLLLLAIFAPHNAWAAQITGRKFTLSNSNGGATGVQYDFASSALPTATAVRSVVAQACTTASGSCTTPTGFTGASATLDAQPTGLGATTSWTDDSVAASLRITHASNVTAPSGAVTIDWGTVTNPTADNTTFFLRVTTYSDSAYTTAIDSGVVAVSTAEQITVSASVDESLTFCTGTSGVTTTSCAAATGNTVSLGTLTTSSTGSGVSQMGAQTNAASGYSITFSGSTLTSGANTITALATQTASSPGNEQFGFNLRDNATPNVGTDPDGAGSASPTANYNTVDQFRFVSGDSIASVAGPDDFRRFHAAYIANISATTEPGTYQTVLTFICTATF